LNGNYYRCKKKEVVFVVVFLQKLQKYNNSCDELVLAFPTTPYALTLAASADVE
jgi:hypothetical protein